MDRTAFRIAALLTGVVLSFSWQLTGLLTQGSKLAVAAILLTYGLMPMVIRFAWKVGALDMPDARRVHAQPTPRIGGLAVPLSVNLTLFLNFNYSLELKGVCISAMIVALLSLWDDLKTLSAATKLIGQLLALGVLMVSGVHVTFATMWHSLCDLECAEAVARSVEGRGLPVLLQVSISGEERKYGIAPDQAAGFLERIRTFDSLKVIGLMGMAAREGDVRNSFRSLRLLRDQLGDANLRELCMGMSGDYHIAIEEGATMVRLGTALFGGKSG